MIEIAPAAPKCAEQTSSREHSDFGQASRGHDRRQGRALAYVFTALLVGLSLLQVPAARAGEWTQITCTQPNGRPAPIEGWLGSSMGGYGADSGPSDTCGQSGGALTALDSSAETESAYTGPMWVYSAPAGSTIAGGAITVSLTTPQGQAYIATPANSYDQADVLINCQYNLPCGSNGTETATVPINHPGGPQLFAAAVCVGPYYGATTCPAGSGGGLNAQINVYAASIELANSSTPAGTGFAGALLAPGAIGTADLTFNAQDPGGPGVYRVIAELDNTTVYQGAPDTNGGRCASIGTDPNGINEFLYAQPCKQNVAVDCEVPPPLGFARRVQVPKALLIDAIQEAALALEGDSNDREHDALAILREELQSWADDDFDIAEVVRITASRKIGDAVISAAGNPKGTALLQLVNSVAQSGQPLVPDAEAGNRV
jgi:hypothetical protein